MALQRLSGHNFMVLVIIYHKATCSLRVCCAPELQIFFGWAGVVEGVATVPLRRELLLWLVAKELNSNYHNIHKW